jgi:hypothetical protein
VTIFGSIDLDFTNRAPDADQPILYSVLSSIAKSWPTFQSSWKELNRLRVIAQDAAGSLRAQQGVGWFSYELAAQQLLRVSKRFNLSRSSTVTPPCDQAILWMGRLDHAVVEAEAASLGEV